MKNIDNLITQMRVLPETSKYSFITEKGGVNKKATTWVIIGYVIFNAIITAARM
jgi:hypothetical protein